MEGLHKNILLMLEFFKDPFLVLRFSYYISMTFLTMPYVILLSMLMILFSNFDKCSDLWQKLELTCELEFHLRDTAD